MYKPLVFFVVIMAIVAGMMLVSRFSAEDRDEKIIDAWCRSEQTELAAYENCVKNSKPKWWPVETK